PVVGGGSDPDPVVAAVRVARVGGGGVGRGGGMRVGGGPGGGRCGAAALEEAGDGGDHQGEHDDDQGEQGGDLRDRPGGGLVHRVQDQLHADEAQDDRQAVAEVDQPVQQAADEE